MTAVGEPGVGLGRASSFSTKNAKHINTLNAMVMHVCVVPVTTLPREIGISDLYILILFLLFCF